MVPVIKKTLSFLGSIRLAIFLLIILAVVSIVGIVIPQGLRPEQYLNKWGEWSWWLLVIGIGRIFSTTWFYLLLALLSCNILVCSMTRLMRNIRVATRNNFLSSAEDAARCRHSSAFTAPAAPGAAVERVAAFLRHHGFTVAVSDFRIVARSGIVKDIGSLLFHLGIVVLFVGGYIGNRFGFSEIETLGDGETIAVREASFLLHCDWFEIERNEQGVIKDYKSKLAILSLPDSTRLVEKVIEVNDPLSYRGYRFYQSTYGIDGSDVSNLSIRITGPGLPDGRFIGVVPYEKTFLLPGSDLTVRVTNFLPDFVIDMATRVPATRSNNPNNPAMKVVLARGEETLYDDWVFFRFPNRHAGETAYEVNALSYDPSYYTGIQVRKNPGVPIIWVGIILMTFGIIAVFYVTRRNIRVFIEPKDNGCAVAVGGSSNRSPSEFQKTFDHIVSQLNATLTRDA